MHGLRTGQVPARRRRPAPVLRGSASLANGERVVIAAPYDDDACPGDPYCNSGAAYVYHLEDGEWVEEAKLTVNDTYPGQWFGYGDVAIDGDFIAVGTPQDNEHGERSGAVYLFVRTSDGWTQLQKVTAPDATVNSRFGESIAFQNDLLFIGASYDDERCGGRS